MTEKSLNLEYDITQVFELQPQIYMLNKKLPIFLLLFLSIFAGACKKGKTIEASLIGTWELHKITFLETNESFPLDSFRNVFNVSLTLKNDFSFEETENIGGVSLGPLGNTNIMEYYNSPRNISARFLIYGSIPMTWPILRSFSISQDLLVFQATAQTTNSFREEVYNRKFNLKSNNELDIERPDLIIFNKQKGIKTITSKLNFSYRRK